jgi:nucleoside-triphosphatase THEP1
MLSSHSNIIIFSKPIHSGKTTALFQYIQNHHNIGGFLTPDVDGKRMLYDIGQNKYYPFETIETDKNEIQNIGRFNFLQSTFETGRNIISQYNKQHFFIIDEVGKLEIEMDKGFEPLIKTIIASFKTHNYEGILLLVIRDTLLEKAIAKYDLQSAKIIDNL